MIQAELCLDYVIDLIYAALLEEASWSNFLAELSKSIPGGRSLLFYHDAVTGHGTWNLNHGLDDATVRNYAEHYCRINPWMPKASVRKIGLGVVAEQMLPAADFRKTEFYNDFFRPIGAESAVGLTVVREEGRSFLLSVLTSRGDPERNKPAADQLTAIAPHLRRAFRHYRAGTNRSQIAEIGSSIFDAIDIGLLIVGEGAAIKSVSECGARIVETGNCVRRTPLGPIRICSQEADTMLRRMLDRTFVGCKTWSAVVNAVKLTFIQVRKDRFSAYFEGPTVVILLEPINRNRAVDLSHLQMAYKLTAGETRVLAGILSGKKASEIADSAERSKETIRVQIKSLCSKMGASSQLEVVRRIGGLGTAASPTLGLPQQATKSGPL
ncbi:MAG: helix-turn-helix transcriptional regulator [Mesorhizobium sp.]|uniref:helix-turn-helix transcriptional regulator n=1 Tax=Mesorhizobium sp. TaxID=1871066 RepID=UPI000FE60F09|nr:LuxR C-terminal-related transcriptional regulator [Mesorhizobium sp.]RWL81375.1 MAG: helix-turn-helix transcriptional regulator [Mesorhizobium sp.]